MVGGVQVGCGVVAGLYGVYSVGLSDYVFFGLVRSFLAEEDCVLIYSAFLVPFSSSGRGLYFEIGMFFTSSEYTRSFLFQGSICLGLWSLLISLFGSSRGLSLMLRSISAKRPMTWRLIDALGHSHV